MRKLLLLCVISFLMATIGCQSPPFPSSSAADTVSDIPPPDSMVSSAESTVASTEETVSDTVNKGSEVPKQNEISNNTSAIPAAESTTSSSVADKPSEPTSDVVPTNTGSSAPPVQAAENAGSGDEAVIADMIIDCINRLRAESSVPEAVKLTGLTKYAEYRSRQLVENFAHDTADERAAATALRYGMYVDPALYGMSGEPYYTACACEAIVKAGFSGSTEYVAGSIAALVRQSASHWNYVGSVDYCYIAVGVTYKGGLWYADIAMSKTDIYEN